MQIFSIIVLVFLALIIVVLGIYLIILRVFFHRCFSKQKNTEKRLDEKSKLIDAYKIDLCWWEKQNFMVLNIVSHEGLKLRGFFLDRNSDKVAIIVHGYRCDYREMSSYAKMFFNMGYSILVTENRGHGKGEGFIGMGFLDKDDILSWINILVEKNPKYKIVLFGLSMGGSAVCLTAGEPLPQNVKCIISDCAFENVYKQIEYVFNKNHGKIKNVILKNFNTYMTRAYDFNLLSADCSVALKKSNIPVMIIHGKSDTYVPVQNALNLEEKIPTFRKYVYLVEGAGHALSYAQNPRKYETKLREFLKQWGM